MPKSLFFLCAVVIFFTFARSAYGQNQTVTSGQSTTPINFPPECVFSWTSSNPSIGLPASGTGNISSFRAINTSNGPVTATITAVPQAATSFAYVTDDQGHLSVINLSDHTIVARIPVGISSIGVAVNNANNRVYVANQQSHSVSVINSLTNTIVTTVDFGVGEPSGVALSPDGSKLYVTDYSQYVNLLRVINTADNSVGTAIPIGENSWGVAVSPDGRFVYTASSPDKKITVIDTQTNTVANTIPAQAPINLCLSPDGKYLYIANTFFNNVSVINIQTNVVSATIDAGDGPYCLVLSPDGSRLYVSNSTANTVTVINTSDNLIVTTINTGVNPSGLCFSADGSKLYLVTLHPGNDNLSVINTATNTLAVINLSIPPSHTFGKFISSSSTCSATPITYSITVNPAPPTPAQLIIPNTFSPNGDGINDTWGIKYMVSYAGRTIHIFNRWGVKVFSSIGYDGQWDGRFNGVDAPAGAYYYVIDSKNNAKPETGWVTLLR